MSAHTERYERVRRELARVGQEHLLRFWDELDGAQQVHLLDDIARIDLDRCAALIDPLVRDRARMDPPERIEPPHTLPAFPGPGESALYERARERGINAIRAGQVAAFTVAGGQGTRLGYEGPKGAFEITPIRRAPLFQVFAETLLGVERRYGRRPPWFVMTSPTNHVATIEVFERRDYFGLSADDVFFFQQGQMPAFLPDGRIALAEKHRVALSPDGHGGSLEALRRSGALDRMAESGIEYISYFQVDNPLVRCIDPLFIGLHIETRSEMSSKAVRKADAFERVGNFCVADGRLTVIEYSDLPEDLARAESPDGSRLFDAGSIAVHVLGRSFVDRLTRPGATVQLPWHRAEKKVECVDDAGNYVDPDEPNAVKLEMFVFDAIPLAENPLVLHTPREDEFSPVKNATGTDSPATAQRDLIRRAARWLEACGCRVPRTPEGEPAATLEISPAFALDAEDLRQRLHGAPSVPPGGRLLLEETAPAGAR